MLSAAEEGLPARRKQGGQRSVAALPRGSRVRPAAAACRPAGRLASCCRASIHVPCPPPQAPPPAHLQGARVPPAPRLQHQPPALHPHVVWAVAVALLLGCIGAGFDARWTPMQAEGSEREGIALGTRKPAAAAAGAGRSSQQGCVGCRTAANSDSSRSRRAALSQAAGLANAGSQELGRLEKGVGGGGGGGGGGAARRGGGGGGSVRTIAAAPAVHFHIKEGAVEEGPSEGLHQRRLPPSNAVQGGRRRRRRARRGRGAGAWQRRFWTRGRSGAWRWFGAGRWLRTGRGAGAG
jgi:hypothetical protein